MTKTSISIIAIALATTLGATSLATTSFAAPGDNGRNQQTMEQGQNPDQGKRGSMNKRGGGEERGSRDHAKRGGAQGGILALVCSDDGGERLDNMLGHLADRVDLTDDQKALFDDFATAATSAQATYAENCVPRAEKDSAEGENMRTFDPVESMTTRATNMGAASTAIESVIPSAEAFFDSLTEEQTAELGKRRGR